MSTVIPEQARLKWRCRRGMLELDILLNTFVDRRYDSLTAAQLETLDVMLDYPDQVLFDLLMKKTSSSDKSVAEMIACIRTALN